MTQWIKDVRKYAADCQLKKLVGNGQGVTKRKANEILAILDDDKVPCKICRKFFSPFGIGNHFKQAHFGNE